jgi:hypothetical protein
VAADGGVGQHGDRARLHFQDAAGDEDELFLAVVGRSMRTAPGLMRVISGVWRGRMPSSPFSPGSATNLASPEKIMAPRRKHVNVGGRMVAIAAP